MPTFEHTEVPRRAYSETKHGKRRKPKGDPPHRFWDPSAVRSPWQRKTEGKEGGGKGTKATNDEGTNGPARKVILGQSKVLKDNEDTEAEDRCESRRRMHAFV